MDERRSQIRRQKNSVGHGFRIFVNPRDLGSDSEGSIEEGGKMEHFSGRFTSGNGKSSHVGARTFTPDEDGIDAQGEDDLKRAANLLAKWIPLLLRGLCEPCLGIVQERIDSLASDGLSGLSGLEHNKNDRGNSAGDSSADGMTEDLRSTSNTAILEDENHISLAVVKENLSYANSTVARKGSATHSGPGLVDSKRSGKHLQEETSLLHQAVNIGEESDDSCSVVMDGSGSYVDREMILQSSGSNPRFKADDAEPAEEPGSVETAVRQSSRSRDAKEQARLLKVGRKKDFICLERVNGRFVNILEGLELHTNVFNGVEQKRIIDFIYDLQNQGRNQEFRERTYSEPRKWMRGKGRVTIQFGCCYNYAVDKQGNPPGIIRDEEVDEIPNLFRMVIKRLVKWHVLPCSCVPDSCIVNIYDVGDCIPPHIDHHDFVRPFCTVSLLSECNIIFGTNLKIAGPGEFEGAIAIPLPVGSVLVLNGNGADVAKHAVPAVPTKRISITFRKMDPSKTPYWFSPDPDLLRAQPLSLNRPPSMKKEQA